MLVTRDPDLIARAVIMSGAYEHNWKKHPVVSDRFSHWQNRLPLYGLRMSNLAAAVALPQISDVPRRARRGRENHDYLAARLNASARFSVPDARPDETRAPDSIQFVLNGFDADGNAEAFRRLARQKGVEVEIFGLSEDNARAFWNWQFLSLREGLSRTREVLERTCDVRLPVSLERAQLDLIATALVEAAELAVAQQ